MDNSDESSDSLSENEIMYYANNDHLPVFKSGLQSGLSTKKILDTIKELNTDNERVAKVVPTSVSHNVAFVVDISSPFVGHVKNVLSDDMGAWTQTGTKTGHYKWTSRGFKEVSNVPRHDKNVYKVAKCYYRNSSSRDLSRIVCHMTGTTN